MLKFFKEFRKNALLVVCMFLTAPLLTHAQKTSGVIDIAYGPSGNIKYDLSKGVFSVSEGKIQILLNTISVFKNNSATVSSKDYVKRIYSKSAVSDAFGKGTKHVITMSGNVKPEMKLVFYTYPKSGYFSVEMEINGQDLKSNYMAPIIGEFAGLTKGNDLRTLFVPFDNDTFISYNAKEFKNQAENTSAEVGVVYDNDSRNGLIAGSIEHMDWKSGVKTLNSGNKDSIEVWAGYSESSVTRDSIAHGYLKGNKVKSPKMFFGFYTDWRTGLEEYSKANRLAEPPIVFKWTEGTPVGWNSWGVLQQKINFENTTAVVDFFADSLKTFRNNGIAYIDLDSFWDNMIKGGYEGDYSRLKEFADYCTEKGLKPGVYWAPFTDWGYRSGPKRRAEGTKYTFGEMWTKVGDGFHDLDGARAIDPTHPGTRERMALVIKKLNECGFKMIKIDFLGHAAIEANSFYDPKIQTGMQAYRLGMEYLLKLLDGKMMVYAAISPSMASGRYVHVRRIACDAWKTIKDTKYTLNSVNYGWWQTYLYDYIDADHVVLAAETEGANKARILSAVVTGTLISGDDFSANGPWKARAKQFLQNPELLKVVKNGKAFRPVEGNTGKETTNLFINKIGSDWYVAVFNYKNEDTDIDLNLKRLGMDDIQKYTAYEVFSGENMPVSGKLAVKVEGASAKLFRIGN